MDKIRIYALTDESVGLLLDALEQAEDLHNDRSNTPGDDEDELATRYSRLQRVLLQMQKRQELVEGEETLGYDYYGRKVK